MVNIYYSIFSGPNWNVIYIYCQVKSEYCDYLQCLSMCHVIIILFFKKNCYANPHFSKVLYYLFFNPWIQTCARTLSPNLACDIKPLSKMRKKKNTLFNTKHALNPNLSPLQPRAHQCPCECRTDKKAQGCNISVLAK